MRNEKRNVSDPNGTMVCKGLRVVENRGLSPNAPADAMEGTSDSPNLRHADVYYEDKASGYRIQQGRILDSNVRTYQFGSDEAETLLGRGKVDHLYGGAGKLCDQLDSRRWRDGELAPANDDTAWRSAA